jgi:uncharacterized membrane protein YbhN (UPF0104 family)
LKKGIITALKILIPLGFGIYLAWYFFDQMSEKDKAQVWEVFSRANYFYIALSIIMAWMAIYSRAVRWSYLLEPLGFQPNKWNNYHAISIGYFMNLLIPRAGELSRAAMMTRYENIPFEKGFGTILAERVIDTIMLGGIAAVTIFLQYDKFTELWSEYGEMKSGGEKSNLMLYILIGLAAAGLVLLFFYFKNEKFRNKIKEIIRGFVAGLTTIFTLKKRGLFIFHTFFIWGMYVLLYLVCFYALPETSEYSASSLMLGFLGGAVGIVIVQGGVGIYPILVASAIAIYYGDACKPMVLGLAWVMWLGQTLVLILSGAISLYLMPKLNEKKL